MTAPRFAAFIALAVLVVSPSSVPAYPPFVVENTIPTWREDAEASKILILAKLDNPSQRGENGDTDLVVQEVLKCDSSLSALKDAKRLTLPRHLEITDPKNPPTYLVFGDEFKGKPDFFRGVVAGPDTGKYLKSLLTLKNKPRGEQLRFYFDYLDNLDKEIAEDAHAEFNRSSNADIGKAAATFPPKVLREWLSKEQVASDRIGFYALLLGYCGGEEDAKLVRGLLEKYKDEKSSALIGLHEAYTLLKPKDGWAYTHAVAKDSTKSVTQRGSVLHAARFFLSEKKCVVEEEALLETFTVLLEQNDIAEYAIEDLRKGKCWNLTDRVLAAAAKKANDTPSMRRCVLCYALQCPDKAAAKYVAEQCEANPELVREVAESL